MPGSARVCWILTASSARGSKAEQFQHGRRDLGRAHRRIDGAVPQAREYDEDRHVAVLLVAAAMLGDLTLAAGIDDAMLCDADDVGVPRIARRNVEQPRRRLAGG